MRHKFVILCILVVLLMLFVQVQKEALVGSVFMEEMQKNGYQLHRNGIKYQELQNLRNEIVKVLSESEDKMQFGNINTHDTNGNEIGRREVLMPFTPIFMRVIAQVCHQTKSIFDKYGTNAWVVEHTVLLSFPGAKPQMFHRDITNHSNNKFFAFLVAVDSIDKSMGPFQYVPKSHYGGEKFEKEKIQSADYSMDSNAYFQEYFGYFENPDPDDHIVDWIASPGDILVYDATLLHRGSANVSDKPRMLYYFGLLFDSDEYPEGSTRSLMEQYKKNEKSTIKLENVLNM